MHDLLRPCRAKRGATNEPQTALYLCGLRSSVTGGSGSQFNVFAARDIAASDHCRPNHFAASDPSRMIVSSRAEPVETTAAGTPVSSSRRAM